MGHLYHGYVSHNQRVTEESTGNSYVLTKHATTVCRSTADKGRKVQGFTIQRQLNRGI